MLYIKKEDVFIQLQVWYEQESMKANGLTQKELSLLILEGQEKINERIDQLHEKVNQKISRAELSGWLVAVSALVVLIQAVM